MMNERLFLSFIHHSSFIIHRFLEETLMSQDTPPGPQTFVPVVLGTAAFAGSLLFLILISGGFFFYVLLVAFAIGGVAGLHYFLWGHSMHQETEGEREEERLREQNQADPW